MKKATISFAILAAAFLTACGAENEENNQPENNAANNESEENAAQGASEDLVTIKTTLFPLEDFAEKIGGDAVEVENIVPLGADAHTFEPSSNQVIEISEADLFIYNGAGYEGFVEQIKDTASSQDVEMLEGSEGIDLISYDHGHDDNNHGNDDNDDHGHSNNENDHGHEDSQGEGDPHVWLDPERAGELAENIKEALIDLRPEEEEQFTANYEELVSELEDLHEQYSETLADTNKDTIVVSHAGYGYWEEQYDIQQHGIAGLSPENEPSIQQLEETIQLMEDQDLNYVLFEQNIPANIAETVRDEAGAEALELHNLEALTEEDVENGEDYFSLMEKNLETLTTALQ
ncbi:metal ABC transporter solute-binding protein, Zn/Mn family [Alkalicoccus saliphilus]|uniref:ABC transporter substrate-binding protein n=1 Tax=Alkalicoccus saliphilus TaxID=200989 RepID=A0A2T4U9A2_9BACI|nr:zinc ABC transporter substrate-binding protein [Alkalicoccus saliphilus]PTL39978.1 ABC transporter substrate-binding protein [Alkalicoccus saliphilus]